MIRTTALFGMIRALAFLIVSCVSMTSVAQSEPLTNIQNLKLVSGRTGWIQVANRLFWTETLGTQWQEITPASFTVAGAEFSSDGTGWAVDAQPESSSVRLAYTSNKGTSWKFVTIASPFSDALISNGKATLSFVDQQHGWMLLGLQSSSAFVRGLLMKTVDGGKSWNLVGEPPVGGGILFTDSLHGFAGPGANGDELYVTKDAGETWEASKLTSPASLTAVSSTITLPAFADATHGTLLRTFEGDTSTTVVQYATSDAGLTWGVPQVVTGSHYNALSLNGQLTSDLVKHAPTALASGVSVSSTLTPIQTSFSTSEIGWVLFSGGSCSQETGICQQGQSLMGTLDGGNTFFQMGQIPGIDLSPSRKLTIKTSNSKATNASPASSSVANDVMGFDACSLPTTTQLQTWATSSPYKTVGIYIGGSMFSCRSGLSNLTASYVSTVLAQGWQIVPIWVGAQAPGGNFSSLISIDTTAAAAQGTTEADSAIGQMAALGIGQGTPIVYDMEAFSYTTSTYAAATQAFLSAWTTELHSKGYLSAVYSSHNEFNIWIPSLVTPPIDTIWFAYFFSSGVACGTSCQTVYPTASAFTTISPYWQNHHRSRQTSSSFNSTYGGLTINLDEDYTDAAFAVATPITLTFAKSGKGTGTISSNTISNGIDSSSFTAISCQAGCTTQSVNVAATDTVTLTAAPTSGSVFDSWTGCTSTVGSVCTITSSTNTTATAIFDSAPTYPLTVTLAGTGSGTVKSSDSYISCGSSCTADYIANATVVLTATPSSTSIFKSWSGCTSSSGTSCTVLMGTSAVGVTATFSPAPTFSAALSPTSLSIVGGTSATTTLTISPEIGYIGSFTGFSCTGLPSTATCSFSESALSATGDGTQIKTILTVTTTPVFSASIRHSGSIAFASLFLSFLGIPVFMKKRKMLHRVVMTAIAIITFGMAIGTTGCAAGDPAPSKSVPPGVPFSGTINVVLTSTSGTSSIPLTLAITAK